MNSPATFALALLAAFQESPPAGKGEPPPAPPLWPMFLLLAVVFWFLMIRPQMKEQKKRQQMLQSLKKHDRVVTQGGLIGTIKALDEKTVTLEIDDKVRAKFQRSAIVGVLKPEKDDEKG